MAPGAHAEEDEFERVRPREGGGGWDERRSKADEKSCPHGII